MHMKRQTVPKSWPSTRKGTTFVVGSQIGENSGIPLTVFLRDLTKAVKTRKEIKKAIIRKLLLINNKPVRDERINLFVFDIVTLVQSNRHFQLTLNDKGKFSFEEIKDSSKKISKILNKTLLKNKKIQLNLNDGKNYLSDIECLVGDSVVIDLVKNKIIKCLPFDEKHSAIAIKGKHKGKFGKIVNVDKESKISEIKTSTESFNAPNKFLMVLE